MKVGVIYCAYNTVDMIDRSLDPWVKTRALGQIGSQTDPAVHDFLVCAVNVAFAGFPITSEDGTRERLRASRDAGNIDHLIEGPDNIPETTARGMALTWLMSQGVDLIWQVDSDEMYTIAQIDLILQTVNLNEWADWFRIAFKNYVFDEKTYLAEPFTPPRIHRVKPHRYANLRPHQFIADNDIGYMTKGEIDGTVWSQDSLTSALIPNPSSRMQIKHITWMNDERSRKKVLYQQVRGWKCSFAWDDQKGLIFNPALPVPKVIREA